MCLRELLHHKCGHTSKNKVRHCDRYHKKTRRSSLCRLFSIKPKHCGKLHAVENDTDKPCSQSCARKQAKKIASVRQKQEQEFRRKQRERREHERIAARELRQREERLREGLRQRKMRHEQAEIWSKFPQHASYHGPTSSTNYTRPAAQSHSSSSSSGTRMDMPRAPPRLSERREHPNAHSRPTPATHSSYPPRTNTTRTDSRYPPSSSQRRNQPTPPQQRVPNHRPVFMNQASGGHQSFHPRISTTNRSSSGSSRPPVPPKDSRRQSKNKNWQPEHPDLVPPPLFSPTKQQSSRSSSNNNSNNHHHRHRRSSTSRPHPPPPPPPQPARSASTHKRSRSNIDNHKPRVWIKKTLQQMGTHHPTESAEWVSQDAARVERGERW
ncbi:hypothetical protein VTJ49DRAFT_1078 [Mycothermus thermophilus]|uniref:Uncharacterized protein n=1 Tax=Humicola insolens TaxID=85995 RepID=A0ABR3VDG5_HUMIN